MNPQQPQQPQQPVAPTPPPANDFLSRMDAVNHPAPVEPEKKKMSTGMIVGIVIGVIAVIGGIVGVIMMMNSGKSTPTPTVSPITDYPDEPEIDEEMEARNKLRAKDLVALGTAVQVYQAQPEAEGQLPGLETTEWDAVIALYTPDGVLKDGATGDVYKMGAVCKFGEDCVDVSKLSWEENKHEIYALYNADCKGTTKENVIVSSTRLRRVAIFAIIEGDQFICATN